jgi:hypothetical protein
MIQVIRSCKILKVGSSSVIPVPLLQHVLFFSPDPTNIFTFDHELATLSTSVTTTVICIEFTRPFEADGSVNEYIENGNHISYNNSLTDNHPTHEYKSFEFCTTEHVKYVLLISNGLQPALLTFDFIYKSIPFKYSTLFPLVKTSHLIYNLETEFPKVSRENTFTFILQIICNVLTPVELKIFSNVPIFINVPASIEIISIHFQFDAVTQRLTWTIGETISSTTHTNDTAVVEIKTVRTIPNALVAIHNLIVLPGKLRESRINSISENNIFIGNKAGLLNQNGVHNIFIGNQAGGVNTAGTRNLFIGDNSGALSTTGHNNVCLGPFCGYRAESDKNVFIGYRSGENTTSGGHNIFIGNECGKNNTTGSDNICLGNHIDALGTNNIFLTNNFLPEYTTESNNLQIGNLITGNMTRKETFISGSLFVDNHMIHPVSKNIRVTLNLMTLVDDIEYTAILDTGCEKINLIQRVQRDTDGVVIDCKASSTQQISISYTDKNNDTWYVMGTLSSDESMQDLFDIALFKNNITMSANL